MKINDGKQGTEMLSVGPTYPAYLRGPSSHFNHTNTVFVDGILPSHGSYLRIQMCVHLKGAKQPTELQFDAQGQKLAFRFGGTSEDPDLLEALLLANWYGYKHQRSAQVLDRLETILLCPLGGESFRLRIPKFRLVLVKDIV